MHQLGFRSSLFVLAIVASTTFAVGADPAKKLPPMLGEPLRLGDIEVTVKEIRIGPSLILRGSKKEIVKSKEDFTTITVDIKNVSERKKVDFKGWVPRGGEEILPILEDDAGNDYKAIRPRLGDSFQVVKETSIYPGKSMEEVIVFEPPVGVAKYLLLSLPADEFGVEKGFTFALPPKSASIKNLKKKAEAEPVAESTIEAKPPTPAQSPDANEKRAASRLKTAKEYLKRPEFEAAGKTTLEKIVSELPETAAGKEAAKILEGLGSEK